MPTTKATPDFPAVFQRLKAILAQYAPSLRVIADTPTDYTLITDHIMPNKSPLHFGAVQIKKNYVSYHLIPVYAKPEMLEGASEALRKRMQGKSCFNFKAVDETLIAELAQLTARGFEGYKEAGYLEPNTPEKK